MTLSQRQSAVTGMFSPPTHLDATLLQAGLSNVEMAAGPQDGRTTGNNGVPVALGGWIRE